MVEQRRGLVVLITVAAGCAPPAVGSRCSPGTPPYIDRDAGIFLYCTAPAGCDRPVFRWSLPDPWRTGGGFFEGPDSYSAEDIAPPEGIFCGCDGRSGDNVDPETEVELPPDVPWQFHGSCADPCETVQVDEYNGHFVTGEGWNGSITVAPQCRSCEGARARLGCTDAEGRAKPPECCECRRAYRDDEGICRSRRYEGLAVADDCCAGD